MPASTQRRIDRVLDKIAEYVTQHKISRKPAYEMARYCLLDSHIAEDYEDDAAADPRIDVLRAKMIVTEDKQFTKDFYDVRKRSNTNAMRIEFRDGSMTPEVRIDYPVGHPRRRPEALPLVEAKFRRSVEHFLPRKRQAAVLKACGDLARLRRFAFDDFMDLFAA